MLVTLLSHDKDFSTLVKTLDSASGSREIVW